MSENPNFQFDKLIVPGVAYHIEPTDNYNIKLEAQLSASVYHKHKKLILTIQLKSTEERDNFKLWFLGKLDFNFEQVNEQQTFAFLTQDALKFAFAIVQDYLDKFTDLNGMPKFNLPKMDLGSLSKQLVENTTIYN